MEHHLVLYLSLFLGAFLFISTLLQVLSKKFTSIPYTVALLVCGFFFQQLFIFFDMPFMPRLPTDVIYYVLLPLLLFESAYHINIHQFKLQFKTITFLSTFGLLVSVFSVATILAFSIGIPFEIALLFGAIISATDPIAVIALFKHLGGPRRLGLVADGESMFNDATGVLVFKVISAFVVTERVFQTRLLIFDFGNFFYVFVGSILFGAVAGALSAVMFGKFRKDRLSIVTLMIALAILSFSVSEHYFGLSGVISCVVTGLILGNFGIPKLTSKTAHFIEEMWEAVSFYGISLIFFFSTFNLDLSLFQVIPWHWSIMAIVAALLARSISIYVSTFITNTLPFFKDEPNIPLRWQHILNWGGLRGVIPLVLVYSLPDTFAGKPLLLGLTMSVFLFTLLVNGFTIKFLLLKLKLHIPAEEEQIIKEETAVFKTEELIYTLDQLPEAEFNTCVLKRIKKELDEEMETQKKALLNHNVDQKTMLRSFQLQTIEIERITAHELHEQGYFNEQVLAEFLSELDLQEDAILYPDIFGSSVDDRTGHIKSRRSFRKMMQQTDTFMRYIPFFKKFFCKKEHDLVRQRYMILKTRIIASSDVIWYLDYVKRLVTGKEEVIDGFAIIAERHNKYLDENRRQLKNLQAKYPVIIEHYEREIIYRLLHKREIHNHQVI
ncbi:MAG: cation:proton antiporter [Patescibacteria group bacterium]